MEIGITALVAVVLLAGLAVAMGWILGWANQAFAVRQDPRIEALRNALPGANCGGCGYVGCQEYAEALASGQAEIGLCGPGGDSAKREIAGILGVELKVDDGITWRAVTFCHAKKSERLKQIPYSGEMSCAGAHQLSGVQSCVYGCLGFGDCAQVCPVDAITIEDGIATIDEDCIACGACVKACPRHVILLVPFKTPTMLVNLCNNRDFGREVVAACKVGCMGCKACTRVGPLIEMEGNLAIVPFAKYEAGIDPEPYLKACKRHSLRLISIKPKCPVEDLNSE